ncbi:GNAT family N-acetyltransferase [Cohnella terricola]|uniref:GNAT family N-acetyltransferase n=1 Tax=Cohnella terricola TaxID=1289167 RepID=A0A559JWK4_9BACL|nr:GNAT family N-acetyltransferase [Cohnella terricola]TVY04256.1 GNAT family N-acetyltransferase [Cohnella terricola]
MPESRIVVRLETPSDRESVRRVLLGAYGQYENTLSRELWENYIEEIEAAAAGKGAATKARFVAELDGAIVGSVFLFESSETAYGYAGISTPIIRLLAVVKAARGQGVATELIRACAELAHAGGAESLHLHTSDRNESAVRLYERLGFERAFECDRQYGDILAKSYRLQLNETELLRS